MKYFLVTAILFIQSLVSASSFVVHQNVQPGFEVILPLRLDTQEFGRLKNSCLLQVNATGQNQNNVINIPEGTVFNDVKFMNKRNSALLGPTYVQAIFWGNAILADGHKVSLYINCVDKVSTQTIFSEEFLNQVLQSYGELSI